MDSGLMFANATGNETLNETGKATPNATVKYNVFAKFYPILAAEMVLSIVCLVLLIFVYYRIKEHKTLPGKIALSLSGCLIACYVLLILDFSLRKYIGALSCLVVAVSVHILFLGAFFWTNVMAYDIMRTMSSIKPNMSNPSSRYWKYALYAWGMTFACSLPAFVLDNVDVVHKSYRPNFGKTRCWLSGTQAFLLYFNGPVGVILLSNCALFVATAVTILKVKSAAAAARVKPHKTRFRLYIKLVVVMGLVWVAEFIPWWTGKRYLYAVAGILNCLYGLYIFVIFCCKARVWKKFKSSFEFSQKCKDQPAVKFITSPSSTSLTTDTSGRNSSSQLRSIYSHSVESVNPSSESGCSVSKPS